jgi:hypothetical protein
MKAISEATHMAQVVVVVKEGMTSRDLISSARSFDFLKAKILSNSHTYLNVEGGFSDSEFGRLMGQPTATYTVESTDELAVLTS